MEFYEAKALLQHLDIRNKESWEQTRMLGYVTAQVNSTKKLKPTDILKFSWDKDDEEQDITISNSQIERLRERAKNYISKQE